LSFDNRGVASLDGTWDFLPGTRTLAEVERAAAAEPITVPGLWEAQGYVDLNGPAWYRRQFELDDASGGWTLRFGAVMDFTDVFVNGRHAGGHELAFTPLEVDPAGALRPGLNTLAVRVVDPAVGDPDHVRMAHGKQGWANHVFPSRPSLYMTYGGIWQPVSLRRHGSQVIRDVFVSSRPDDLVATVEVENRGPAGTARVLVRTLGMARERQVRIDAGQAARVDSCSARSTPRVPPGGGPSTRCSTS
jgi:beta-galactosidase/beta-glucuronidase